MKDRCSDLDLAGVVGRGLQVCPLEQVDELAIAPGDLGNGLIARRLFAPPGDQRIPENGAADRKSDETRYSRRDFEPFCVLSDRPRRDRERCSGHYFAPPARAAVATRFAILAPIEPFDFPQIRFDAGCPGVPEWLRPSGAAAIRDLIRFPVALESVELHFLRRHQQLEHEPAAARGQRENRTGASSVPLVVYSIR